jgi:hypothetical protein
VVEGIRLRRVSDAYPSLTSLPAELSASYLLSAADVGRLRSQLERLRLSATGGAASRSAAEAAERVALGPAGAERDKKLAELQARVDTATRRLGAIAAKKQEREVAAGIRAAASTSNTAPASPSVAAAQPGAPSALALAPPSLLSAFSPGVVFDALVAEGLGRARATVEEATAIAAKSVDLEGLNAALANMNSWVEGVDSGALSSAASDSMLWALALLPLTTQPLPELPADASDAARLMYSAAAGGEESYSYTWEEGATTVPDEEDDIWNEPASSSQTTAPLRRPRLFEDTADMVPMPAPVVSAAWKRAPAAAAAAAAPRDPAEVERLAYLAATRRRAEEEARLREAEDFGGHDGDGGF